MKFIISALIAINLFHFQLAFCELIPKQIHFVWVVNPLPEKYAKNIGEIAAANPDYQTSLWIDAMDRVDEFEKNPSRSEESS